MTNSKLCTSCACLDFHKCIHNWTIRAWSSAWGKATFRPDWVGLLAPWCVEEQLEAEERCGGWPEEAWEDEVEEVYWGELYPLEVCFYLTVCHPTLDQERLTPYSLLINLCLWLYGSHLAMFLCCTGKRVPMGSPMRGRGSVGRIAMRRGGRHRGGLGGRGGALSRGAARGGIVRGEMNSIFIVIDFIIINMIMFTWS